MSFLRSLSETAAQLQNSPGFAFFSRIFLGSVFLYASLNKILHPRDFVLAIENYRLLPPVLVPSLAVILPWLEALTGLFLILGIFTRACGWVLFILLLVFTGALASALFRGLDIVCGCFDLKYKTSRSREIYGYIFRDFIFLFFAYRIIKASSAKFSLANVLPPPIKKLMD